MSHTSITLTDTMKEQIDSYLSGTESISQFVFKATEEKIKRMEVRDKNARLQLHKKDTELLEPIITDVLKMHGVIQ